MRFKTHKLNRSKTETHIHNREIRREESRRYLLVDFDTDGSFGDVPDPTGAAMVELVRHTLVDGSVNLHIDEVSDPIRSQVSRQRNIPLLPEGTREQISGSSPQTVTRRHLLFSSPPLCQKQEGERKWRPNLKP